MGTGVPVGEGFGDGAGVGDGVGVIGLGVGGGVGRRAGRRFTGISPVEPKYVREISLMPHRAVVPLNIAMSSKFPQL